MHEFVELWVYLSATPLFGLTLTLVVYVLASAVYARCGHAPWANPVLWSVVVLAGVLTAAQVPYPSYFSGAQFIHFLLGPAVVALGWPMWQRRAMLWKQGWRLLGASILGGAAASVSAVGLAWWMGLPTELLLSLLPKSLTAPVAMGVAERVGGVPALAAVISVLTGMVGALTAKYVFDLIRVPRTAHGWAVRGYALGTAAHGIGAARALQVNADAGAFAGVALGMQVILASLIIPLIFRLLGA